MIVFKPHDVFRFTPEIMKSIDGIRKAEITQEVALEGPDLFLFYTALYKVPMNYKLSPNDSVDADCFIYVENERNANNLCVQFAEEILNIFNAFQDEGRVNVYPIEEPIIFWNPHYLTA